MSLLTNLSKPVPLYDSYLVSSGANEAAKFSVHNRFTSGTRAYRSHGQCPQTTSWNGMKLLRRLAQAPMEVGRDS